MQRTRVQSLAALSEPLTPKGCFSGRREGLLLNFWGVGWNCDPCCSVWSASRMDESKLQAGRGY